MHVTLMLMQCNKNEICDSFLLPMDQSANTMEPSTRVRKNISFLALIKTHWPCWVFVTIKWCKKMFIVCTVYAQCIRLLFVVILSSKVARKPIKHGTKGMDNMYEEIGLEISCNSFTSILFPTTQTPQTPEQDYVISLKGS